MPVDTLLVEGVTPTGNKLAQGLDLRLLNKLLAGVCTVRPRGSKFYMAMHVQAAREAGRARTYALLDGDFTYPWSGPRAEPVPWHDAQGAVLLGWRWSRKEVENYLLDPEVVRRALEFDEPTRQRYELGLMQALSAIGTYQAARMALASVRPRPNTLANGWGRARGGGKIPFPEPEDRSDAACRRHLEELMSGLDGLRLPPDAQAEYERECRARATEPEMRHTRDSLLTLAIERFEALVPACQPGGACAQDGLSCFAGKDLAWAMEEALHSLGYSSPTLLLEKVMVAIEDSREDVWTWLPEWSALRVLAQSV